MTRVCLPNHLSLRKTFIFCIKMKKTETFLRIGWSLDQTREGRILATFINLLFQREWLGMSPLKNLFFPLWQMWKIYTLTCCQKINFPTWWLSLGNIRQHLTCKTPFVVYLLFCKMHKQYYTGSTKNLRFRWAQHKSGINKRRENKCRLAQHVLRLQHPADVDMPFLEIYTMEAIEREEDLLQR